MKRELLIHKGDSPQELFSAVKQFLGMYENGVIVTVEPYCSPRTAKQNGTYQLWVKRIHSQTGIPTDQLKKMAKEMAVGYGYPVERDEDGEPILQYGSVVPKSTRDVAVEDMVVLLRCLEKIAIKHDVVIDDVRGK